MIYSRNFILLNYPKTGTSFLRKAIAQTHKDVGGRRYKLLPKSFWPKYYYYEKFYPHPVGGRRDQHGFRRLIEGNDDTTQLSIAREPISWLISSYKYQLWAHATNERVKEFPGFPKLSIEEYNRYRQITHDDEWNHTPHLNEEIGWLSQYFIRFYASNTLIEKLRNVRSVEELMDRAIEDFKEIRFLNTKNLTQGFCAFLEEEEYPIELIDRVRSMPRENVSLNPLGLDEKMSDGMISQIREQERVLYAIRERLGID